jgi:hypothetical protein
MAKKCMKEGGKVKKMAVGGGLADPNKPPTSFFNAVPRSMSPNNIFRSIPAGASLVPASHKKNSLTRQEKQAAGSLKTALVRGAKNRNNKMASGGSVSSASKRADGIATKGKTKGKII